MIKEELLGHLCWLFNFQTDELFIQANPQASHTGTPRPVGLYGMLNIISMRSVSLTDRVRYVERTNYIDKKPSGIILSEALEGHRQVVVSINTYRSGAFNLINTIYNKLQSTSTIEYFSLNKLGYVSRSSIRDVTLPIDAGLEERHQFDLTINTLMLSVEVVPHIEQIIMDSTIRGTQKTLHINSNK